MQQSPQNITPIYRYPGVQPFKVSEREIFFGRKKDEEAFYNFIFSRQLVVLYGKSGYGKSSLINAGIIPKLQVNPSNTYFNIRFNNYAATDINAAKPVDSLNESLKKCIQPEQQENLLLKEIAGPEKTFWYWLKLVQKNKQAGNIIIFFDQFEELFTYPTEQINIFSEQLADAIYTAIPVKYRKALAEKEKDEELNKAELEWLFEKPQVKIVLSIRSDRMSLLNQVSDRHTSILANCYELLPLSEDDARDAIIKPAEIESRIYTAPPFSYGPGLVNKILNSFKQKPGENIETNILQIICRYIEESLVIEQQKINITSEDVGEISNVLYRHYENILNKLDESNRLKAQKLIEENLITANQRNTLSEAYIKKEFGIDNSLLQTLESSSLLRKERDASGRLLYEISHDTLIEPIQKVAEERLKKEEYDRNAEEERQNQIEQQRVQEELKKQVQIEQDRVEELNKLNQRVRNRSRIALTAAVLAIAIAIFAASLYIRANNERANAEHSQIETQETLKSLNYQKALELYTKGNQFRDYQEYQLAFDAYDSAKNFLGTSKINQGSGKISESDFMSLTNKIQHQLDSLQESKAIEK